MNKNTKIGLGISILLHSLLILSLMLHKKKIPQAKSDPPSVTMEIGSPPPPSHIVAPNDLPSPVSKPLKKKGYYGIGVYVSSTLEAIVCDTTDYVGMKITLPVTGYPAEQAGIVSGDIILAVNGNPVSNTNDVVGKDESEVTLTLCHNGMIKYLNLKRTFIYND
jgi:membrane-associated protease RseP (regulator of RpoE activity)